MKQGRMSYSKVRAMTRVATPENEEQLIELAKHMTAAQLQIVTGKYSHWEKMTTKDRINHLLEEEARYVRQKRLATGMVKIEAVLHAEEADVVLRAIPEAARCRPKGFARPPRRARGSACEASPKAPAPPADDDEFIAS
jgi:hypothetical protein